MNRKERIVVTVVFVVLATAMSFVNTSKWAEGQADTAFLTLITHNVATTGRADNPLFRDHLVYVERIALLPAEEGATVDLTPPKREFNHLRFHGYFILYVLAPIVWVVPAHILWPILIVLANLGLLAVAYVACRRQGVSVAMSAAFSALVSYHPVWSVGVEHGQIFVDRLFLGLGCWFLLAFTTEHRRSWEWATAAVLCGLLIERMALMTGYFLIAYTILFWWDRKSGRRIALGLGVVLIAFGAATIGFYLDNAYYSGSFMPRSVAEVIARFDDPVFADNTLTFLGVNFGMMGLAAMFAPRALLLVIPAVIPNIVGNIGGAEKIGWDTHYHSLYLPFLVWAAASGYAKIHAILPNRGVRAAAYLVVLGVGFWASGTAPRANGIVRVAGALPDFASIDYRQERFAAYRLLQQHIAPGSHVTGPEGVFPALYRGRRLNLFPLGLEDADYAIPGLLSYLGAENGQALEQALLVRMGKIGYDVENPVRCGQFLVYHRKTAGAAETECVEEPSPGGASADYEVTSDDVKILREGYPRRDMRIEMVHELPAQFDSKYAYSWKEYEFCLARSGPFEKLLQDNGIPMS